MTDSSSRKSVPILRRIILYEHTATHFIVDLTCYYLLAATPWQLPFLEVAVIYVLIAFAAQLLIGIWSDKRPQAPLLPIGLALILIAFWPRGLLRLILMAAGNALFHTYAGRTILKRYSYTANGLFNGAGGLGLVTGTWLGVTGHSHIFPFALVIAALAAQAAMYFVLQSAGREERVGHAAPAAPERYRLHKDTARTRTVMLLLLFIGAAFAEWSSLMSQPRVARNNISLLWIGAVAWLAKLLGSYVYQRLYSPTAVMIYTGTATIALAVMFPFPPTRFIALAVIQILNLYPLYGMKALLPERPGFAFGLNKLGLALAFLLSLLPRGFLTYLIPLFGLLILSMYITLSLHRESGTKEDLS